MANKLSDTYQLSAKTATATGGSYSALDTDGSLHVHVFSASTSSATVLVEQSLDGSNWFAAQTVSNPTSTGSYLIGPIAPFNRVRISAYTSGTVTALLSTSNNVASQWKSITASDQIINAGGSTTQVQYNNNGSLGGMTATWDGTTLALTGDATVSGTLGVSGASTLASAGVTGALTVGTTLGVTGATTLAAATVAGLAILSGGQRVTAATPPASAAAAGTANTLVIGTDGYIYFCTATNTWVRAQMVTW